MLRKPFNSSENHPRSLGASVCLPHPDITLAGESPRFPPGPLLRRLRRRVSIPAPADLFSVGTCPASTEPPPASSSPLELVSALLLSVPPWLLRRNR